MLDRKFDSPDRQRLSPRWQALNGVLNSAMVWWRFALISAAVLIIKTPDARENAHRVLLTWAVSYGIYSVVALWISVAFPAFYHKRPARRLRILVDVAAITIALFIDPLALRFLWVFYAMRVLAALRYFDGNEWWIVLGTSIVSIVAATLTFEPLGNGNAVAIVGKSATLGVITGGFHYLQRLIPRLSNADFVSESALKLLQGLDRGQILEQIAHLVRDGIPTADSVVIHMLGGDDGITLIPVFGLGIDISLLGRSPMRLGEGIAGRVLSNRIVDNVGDVRRNQHFQPLPEDSPSLVSLLVAPMYMGDRNIGTISVNSWRRRAFDDRDEQLTRTAASQAALALANNRLFERGRRQRNQLSQILNASLTFNPLQPVDRLLDQLAEAVCRYSAFGMAAVNLIDDAMGTVSVVATAGIPQPAREELMKQRILLSELEPLLQEQFQVSSILFRAPQPYAKWPEPRCLWLYPGPTGGWSWYVAQKRCSTGSDRRAKRQGVRISLGRCP